MVNLKVASGVLVATCCALPRVSPLAPTNAGPGIPLPTPRSEAGTLPHISKARAGA